MFPSCFPVMLYKHIYDYLFYYDHNVHTPNYMGSTGNLEGIKWIEKHAKWEIHQYEECLIEACEYGKIDVIEYLYETYAPTDKMRIVDAGLKHVKVLEFALEKNIILDLNLFRQGVLSDVIENNYEETFIYLMDRVDCASGITWNFLSRAVHYRRMNLIKIIMSNKRIRPQIDMTQYYDAIVDACQIEYAEAIEYLIECNPEELLPFHVKYTMLYWACVARGKGVIECLLDSDISKYYIDQWIIDQCILYGKLDTVKFLAEDANIVLRIFEGKFELSEIQDKDVLEYIMLNLENPKSNIKYIHS